MSEMAELLYRLNERAGICEFDGGMSRAEAEDVAIAEAEADPDFGPGIKRQAIRMFRDMIDSKRQEAA